MQHPIARRTLSAARCRELTHPTPRARVRARSLSEADAGAFGPAWTVNADLRALCDSNPWCEQKLESGVVLQLNEPITFAHPEVLVTDEPP